MKIFCILLSLFLSSVSLSQNLVLNPSFEDGVIPSGPGQVYHASGWLSSPCSSNPNGSPDLFDARSADACYGIPSNKWTQNLPANTPSTVSPTTNRYVGFVGSVNTSDYAECIIGTLSTSLTSGQYEISFFVAMANEVSQNCSTWNSLSPHPNITLEAVLIKNGSCSTQKVICVTSAITTTTWEKYGCCFYINEADAANGFDRIEFRITNGDPCSPPCHKIVYLDDIYLARVVILESQATRNFCGTPINEEAICQGPNNLYQLSDITSGTSQPFTTSPFFVLSAPGTYTIETYNEYGCLVCKKTIFVEEVLGLAFSHPIELCDFGPYTIESPCPDAASVVWEINSVVVATLPGGVSFSIPLADPSISVTASCYIEGGCLFSLHDYSFEIVGSLYEVLNESRCGTNLVFESMEDPCQAENPGGNFRWVMNCDGVRTVLTGSQIFLDPDNFLCKFSKEYLDSNGCIICMVEYGWIHYTASATLTISYDEGESFVLGPFNCPGAVSYQLFRDGVAITPVMPGNSFGYPISNASEADEGHYYALFYDQYGCVLFCPQLRGFMLTIGGPSPNNTFVSVKQPEVEERTNLSVYPNPCRNDLMIVSDLEMRLIEVLDITGKLLLSVEANSDNVKLDMKNIIQGPYIIRVSFSGETSSSQYLKVIRE